MQSVGDGHREEKAAIGAPPGPCDPWYTQDEVNVAIRQALLTLKSFMARCPVMLDVESMESHALRGSEKALRTFDPTKGARFSTYANVCARNAILEGFRSEDFLSRTRRERVKATGVQSGIDLHPLHLDEVVGSSDDGETVFLRDAIEDENADMEMKAISSDEARYVNGLAVFLNADEAMVIRLIYFRDMNRVSVGRLMGITKAMVSALEQRSLHIMRKAAMADPHCPLLDDIEDDADAPLFTWCG